VIPRPLALERRLEFVRDRLARAALGLDRARGLDAESAHREREQREDEKTRRHAERRDDGFAGARPQPSRAIEVTGRSG